MGGILAPRLHENIKNGSLSNSDFVELVENIGSYSYFEILSRMGIELSKLGSKTGLNEYNDSFDKLANNVKSYHK